jgi:dihydroorotate dehydrogenase electron transfer subunit
MSATLSASTSRGQFQSIVTRNAPLCREHFQLTLRLPAFPETLPGQFVQVACADDPTTGDTVEHAWGGDEDLAGGPFGFPAICGAELTDRTAVLRRPFSLAGRWDLPGGEVEINLIHRVVGTGTQWLSRLSAGDAVNLIGPLGNAFPLPPTGSTALLVGGGVGIPPMIYLASRLATTGHAAVAFAGALTRELMSLSIEPTDDTTGQPAAREFARHGFATIFSTDDGTLGFRGYVTQALERWLDEHRPTDPAAPPPTIYTCGPELMMKRVADIAGSRGLTAYVAVERAMACGMGTCQSCVIRVRDASGMDKAAWRYRLACTDGPVFAASQLLW